MMDAPSDEWVKKMAELEDGCIVSVGGLASRLGSVTDILTAEQLAPIRERVRKAELRGLAHVNDAHLEQNLGPRAPRFEAELDRAALLRHADAQTRLWAEMEAVTGGLCCKAFAAMEGADGADFHFAEGQSTAFRTILDNLRSLKGTP